MANYLAKHELIDPSFEAHRSGDLIFYKRLLNHESGCKYVVNVAHESGHRVGSVSVYQDNGSTRFAGITVNEDFRGKGLSKVILAVVQQICLEEGRPLVITTQQRKPLVCSLLIQSGFMPLKEIREGTRVYVGRLIEGDSTGVFFEDKCMGHHVSKEVLFRTQGCTRVESLKDLINPISVRLYSIYRKTALFTPIR